MNRYGWDNERYNVLEEPTNEVAGSLQRASVWFLTLSEEVKEYKYISLYIRRLSQSSSDWLERFRSILEVDNLSIEYCSIDAIKHVSNPTLEHILEIVFDTLDAIKMALTTFINVSYNIAIALSSRSTELLVHMTRCYKDLFYLQSLLHQNIKSIQVDTIFRDHYTFY